VDEQGLFTPKPVPQGTEALLLSLLRRRYTQVTFSAHRYAFAEHVPDDPAFPSRIADFIACDCWRSGKFALHGCEVKVSRADWLAELHHPEKALAFRPYMNYWWLVIAHPSIVHSGELPDGWGVLVKKGPRLVAVVKAPYREARPLPTDMLAALMRGVAKTAREMTARELARYHEPHGSD
jgi:hypothetical protein